ncbi:MAG: hypothetical protein K0S74_1690 [Chlamydiales bacterium]|jgi:hypothetical protein|nr:hypothetical protein [Chlamydiales bacterium]
MSPITKFEASYKSLIESLPDSIPDGVIHINLELLHSLNLLDHNNKLKNIDNHNQFKFQVNEGSDKLTLYNEKFVVWVVPQLVDYQPTTFALVALNNSVGPATLELVFAATGVYNSSKIVLRVLGHYLNEIYENESMIDHYKETT